MRIAPIPTPIPHHSTLPPTATSDGDGGLSGDEKVAIGVGVAFGVLLLLLLFAGWRSFRRWREVQEKIVEGEKQKVRHQLRAVLCCDETG